MGDAEFPESQRRYRRLTGFVLVEALLSTTVLALVFQAFVRENLDSGNWILAALWKLKILDTGVAATLAIGLITLRLARDQFVRGSRPYLAYSIDSPRNVDKPLLPAKASGLLVVSLVNFGAGTAVVTNFAFSLSERGGKGPEVGASPRSLEEILSSIGLKTGSDYSLRHADRGFSLGGAGSREAVLEMTERFTEKVARLDVTLSYVSLLGEHYRKEIYCIPRRLERQVDERLSDGGGGGLRQWVKKALNGTSIS